VSFDQFGPVSFVLVTRNGRKIRGRFLCGLLEFLAQMPWRSAGRQTRHKYGLRRFGGSLYSHFFRHPDLRKIDSEQVRKWLPCNREGWAEVRFGFGKSLIKPEKRFIGRQEAGKILNDRPAAQSNRTRPINLSNFIRMGHLALDSSPIWWREFVP
jgi:hypothetical protein